MTFPQVQYAAFSKFAVLFSLVKHWSFSSFWLFSTSMNAFSYLIYLLFVLNFFMSFTENSVSLLISTAYGTSLFSLILQWFAVLTISPEVDTSSSPVRNITFSAFLSEFITKCLVSLSKIFLFLFTFRPWNSSNFSPYG